MIISRRTTFHARLAVKGANIYLSVPSRRLLLLVFFCYGSIYVPGISQVDQTAKYKPALIYIRLRLRPCLSHKADDVLLRLKRRRGGRDGSETQFLTPRVLPAPLDRRCALFSFLVRR